MYAPPLSISHHVSPADASTIADVEDRIFSSWLDEQSPGLRAARRRFLELNELSEAGEKHGALGTKNVILLGRARTLALSAGASHAQNLLNINMNRAGESSGGTVNVDEIHLHIEAKHSQVGGIPGMRHVSGQSSGADATDEQCRLLSAHAQYIGELAGETELLASLCSHAKSHPIHEAARGLESYFGGLIDSLCLKLKIIAGDMRQTLYSPSTTKALESLQTILKEREAKLKRERSALDERLAIYAQAGSEFQDIASSYAAILKESDQVRGDIARIAEL